MKRIPTVEDFTAAPIEQAYDDLVNPPGLTNFLGVAQVDHDITAVRSVHLPPVGQGDTVTAQLFLDGRLFRSYGVPVTLRWRPDRVDRWTEADGLRIETTTVMPDGVRGVVVDLRVTNTGASRRSVRVGLGVESAVTRPDGGWPKPEPPLAKNVLTAVPGRVAVIGRPVDGAGHGLPDAVCVQGIDDPAGRVDPRSVETTLELEPGATGRLGYAQVTDVDETLALQAYDRIIAAVPGAAEASRQRWNGVLRAAFTPGNAEFSGHVPVLETTNEALRSLYWWGILGVVWFRRDNPSSVLGRTYDTLMPRYWQTTTFIWDFSLSSMIHALLDPEPMRRQLEHWITTDIHRHFGTEWLTGGPVGYWYSVNDYAMTRLVRDYVRWNGRADFLDVRLAAADGPQRPVAEHLRDWALAWKGFRRDHALADYGEIDNLLECVSSYVHEVASLNAANVWCMRRAAEIALLREDPADAAALEAEASELLEQVRALYVEGKGYWQARQPDGRLVPVRHCYDLATIGTTIADDLSPSQRAEMADFFVRELQTPSWMRALSPYDGDAAFSLRPDHQWNGAYPAWPADVARALIALGHSDLVAAWLPGLARTTLQGPPGQAHFVEEAAEPIAGGARKSPPQFPYLIDWACSSAGAWSALVVEGIFGVDVELDGTVSAAPRAGGLAAVDAEARLVGLRIGDRSYDVSLDGARLSPRPGVPG